MPSNLWPSLDEAYMNTAFVPEAVHDDRLSELDLKPDKLPDKLWTFDEALHAIGFGRMQIVVLLVSGIIIMTVLTETMGMGFIMPAAHCDMQLSSTRKGIISSVTFVGILVSSQVWGFLADTRGRRKVICATMLAANACTVCSSFSVDFSMFVALRFFSGVFMSASSCVTYAYLGEFNTNKNRSSVIAYACIFAGLAYLYLPLMGYLILPASWSLDITAILQYRPWRLLLIANTAPGFLAALCLCWLPESGKFLITQGRESEAIAVLRRIYCFNTGRPAETYSVKHLLPEHDIAPTTTTITETDPEKVSAQPTPSVLQQFWHQTVPLFCRPLRFNFLICCFLVFGVFFVSAGIGMWYPEIQNRVARSTAPNEGGRTVCVVLEKALPRMKAALARAERFDDYCNDTVEMSTFKDGFILGGYYLLMYLVYALGIRQLGQGVFLVTFLFASGAAGLALQWVTAPWAVVALFTTHIVFSGICISMLTGIVVLLIPTEYRGMAVSISMMFGRMGSIVGSNLVGVLLESNCQVTFSVYTGFILVCAMMSLLLPIRSL